MPRLLVIIPAPSAQRAPHAFTRAKKGATWLPDYQAHHRAGVIEALGRLPVAEKPATTGPFVRPGGWSTLDFYVPGELYDDAVAQWRAYWDAHFWTPFPVDEAEGFQKFSDGLLEALGFLASVDPRFAPVAQAVGVMDRVGNTIIDATKNGESVIAAVSPEAREVLAGLIEAVQDDVVGVDAGPGAAEALAELPPDLATRLRALEG